MKVKHFILEIVLRIDRRLELITRILQETHMDVHAVQEHLDDLADDLDEQRAELLEAVAAVKADNPDIDFSRIDAAVSGIESAVDSIPTSGETTGTPPVVVTGGGTNSGAGSTITPNAEGDPAPSVDDGTLGQSHVDNGRPPSDAIPTSYADMSAETDPPQGGVEHSDGTVSPPAEGETTVTTDDGTEITGDESTGEGTVNHSDEVVDDGVEHSDGTVSPDPDPVDSTSTDDDPGIEEENLPSDAEVTDALVEETEDPKTGEPPEGVTDADHPQ